MRRRHVNKRGSARRFRKNVSRTHKMNMRLSPMRGGYRI